MTIYKIEKHHLPLLRVVLRGTGTWSYTPIKGGMYLIVAMNDRLFDLEA